MTFIIAEAGINHCGDIELAHKLIDAAYMAGSDAVKFQTFSAEKLEPPGARREMLKSLELSPQAHYALRDYCGDRIEFMSTPFSVGCLDFLVKHIKVKRLKISSGGLRDRDLLAAALGSSLPVILSTGMADYATINGAIRHIGKSNLTLLHCVSTYPAPIEDTNLLAMRDMQDEYELPVGLSDHSLSTVIPAAAVAMGATVIEKHITLDRNMKGPDHAASLEPHDFKRMVDGIREVEKAMGDGIKRPMPSEAKTIEIVKERRAWAA